MSDDTYIDMSYHTPESAAAWIDSPQVARVARAKAVRTSGGFAAAMGAQIEREIVAGTFGGGRYVAPSNVPTLGSSSNVSTRVAPFAPSAGTIEYVHVMSPDGASEGESWLNPTTFAGLGLAALAALFLGGLA